MINSFRGKYFFLSNFFVREVLYKGYLYKSSEHAFQAQKATNRKDHDYIADADTPKEAKHRGYEVQCRSDWEKVKVGIMSEIVYYKFAQNEDLRMQLIATGDQELIEGNTWGDQFWGFCDGEGFNWLGTILVEVRALWKS